MTILLTDRVNLKLRKIMMLPPILLLALFVGMAVTSLEFKAAVAPSRIQPETKLWVDIETLLV